MSTTPLDDGEVAAPPPAGARPIAPGYAAFEAQLAGVVDGAFRTALRLTGNRQDAEDLVQEAALGAFRGRATFEPGSNFRAWFYRVLLNCFYGAHRKRRPEQSLADVEDAHDLFLYEHAAEAGLLSVDDPVQATIGQLASNDIAAALAALPEKHRAVCTMYFMEDFAYEEIAHILGVPIGTVRSRLHRGRAMLQKKLWTLAVDQGVVLEAADRALTGEDA
ncbi:MAG: sigma-70 family RNA polymerase sigma factor [Gemmatimonadaceae bacterium]